MLTRLVRVDNMLSLAKTSSHNLKLKGEIKMFLFDQKQAEEDTKLSADLLTRKDELSKTLLSRKISWEDKKGMIDEFNRDAGSKVLSDAKSTWCFD